VAEVDERQALLLQELLQVALGVGAAHPHAPASLLN
jgi:hypothetical protein